MNTFPSLDVNNNLILTKAMIQQFYYLSEMTKIRHYTCGLILKNLTEPDLLSPMKLNCVLKLRY